MQISLDLGCRLALQSRATSSDFRLQLLHLQPFGHEQLIVVDDGPLATGQATYAGTEADLQSVGLFEIGMDKP